MFTASALLCLVFLSSAEGNWSATKDKSYGGLGFYEIKLECNEALSECERHFGNDHLSQLEGFPVKTVDHVFKYTKDPYKIDFVSTAGFTKLKASFNQDDPSETFHTCSEITESKTVPGVGPFHGKWSVCLEKNFSGLTVPADCTAPLAVSKVVASFNDEEMEGQQVLYCLPS